MQKALAAAIISSALIMPALATGIFYDETPRVHHPSRRRVGCMAAEVMRPQERAR